MLTAASHFGGSLTHGEDFLTRYAPGPLRYLAGGRDAQTRLADAGGDASEQPFATAVVLPTLDRTCVPCHGPEKAKGELRLDSLDALRQGCDSGPVIQPGRPGECSLMQRVTLSLDHDDPMPPAGKPQPTADELALLRWWVEVGAPADRKLSELNATSDILEAAALEKP